eukprot:COSAG05_NODE_4608_length_1440_cov_1.304251_2_plen_327_part_01
MLRRGRRRLRPRHAAQLVRAIHFLCWHSLLLCSLCCYLCCSSTVFFALSLLLPLPLPCSHSAAAAAAAAAAAVLPLQLSRCVLLANSPRSHRSDAGCAAVFLPFWDSCGWELGSADDYAQVISMCEATIAAAAQGEDGAAAECACAVGWRGLRCENPTGCDGSPCGAHGTCTASGGSHSCACRDGWIGADCEHDPCSSSPCQNGGSCVVIDHRRHLEEQHHRLLQEGDCSSLIDDLNAQCCGTDDQSCANGMPTSCDIGCATAFFRLWKSCGSQIISSADSIDSSSYASVNILCEATLADAQGYQCSCDMCTDINGNQCRCDTSPGQ